MGNRAQYRTELRHRLGDEAAVVFDQAELNDFLDSAVEGLYPTFYQRKVSTTVAGGGPLQTMPATARNLHRVGQRRAGSNRVRNVRSWEEGDGQAYVPKTGITGEDLVWAWTSGWAAPANDAEVYTHPAEAREVVLIRAHIVALESLLSSRVKQDKYHALHVRPGVTEDDVVVTLEALHASLRERHERTIPLPEVQK